MMLHKPLVSFIAAFALASGIAVSATPVARGNDGGYPPPNVPPVTVNECDTGSMSCCNTYTSTSNPLVGELSGLLGVAVDSALGVGLSCVPIILSSVQW
jgi:Fungal hydrophobin